MTRNKIITLSGLFLIFFISIIIALAFLFGAGNFGVLNAEAQETATYADHDHSGYTKLTDAGGTLSSGNYYLESSITLQTDITIAMGATVTIDLNGNMLKGTGTGSVITVKGTSTFTLEDCGGNGYGTITGGSATKGGGVYVTSMAFSSYGGLMNAEPLDIGGIQPMSAKFIMKGGTIMANSATYGGGVYLDNYAEFTMEGGNITGNTADESGAGIYMYTSSKFTLNGGLISSNKINGFEQSSGPDMGSKFDTCGGGIYAYNATITLEKGTILLNAAGEGGGIYLDAMSTLTINSCDINSNTSNIGGGVAAYNGSTFLMNNGTISKNNSSQDAGVYLDNSNFTMEDGQVNNNTSSSSCGGVGGYSNSVFTMKGGTISGNTASNGGGVYVSGATFNMNGGTISGNTLSYGAGGGVYLSNGDFTMSDGTISSNTASQGGGVYLFYANFTMSGGTISSNSAAQGSGICVQINGTAQINDGNFSGDVLNSGIFAINGGNFVDQSLASYLTSDRIFVEYQSGYEGYVEGFPYVVCTQSSAQPETVTINWQSAYEYSGEQIEVSSNLGEISNFQYLKDGGQSASGLPKDAGTYTVTFDLYYFDKANAVIYDTNYSKTISINSKPVNVNWENTTLTYNGKAQAPTATAETGIDGESLTITVSGAEINAGANYTATANQPNGNYTLTNPTQQFTINAKTVYVVWTNTTLTYNGTPQVPTATVSTGISGESIKLVISGAQINAGTGYTATAAMAVENNNYILSSLTTSTTYTINKKTLYEDMINHIGNQGYTGSQIMPLITFIEGEPISESDYELSYGANIEVEGSVTIHLTSDGNYKFDSGVSSITLTFVISKDLSLLSLTINDVEYNGKAQTPDIYLGGEVFNSDQVTLEWSNNKDVGTASVKIIAKDGGSYSGDITIYFNITPKTISVVWGETQLTYSGAAQTPAAMVIGANGEELKLIISGAEVNVGTGYTAKVEIEDDNYNLINTEQTFEIKPKEISVVWSNLQITYDGQPHIPTATATGVFNENIELIVSGEQINAGTHTVTAEMAYENSNYVLTKTSTTFIISQKVLTKDMINDIGNQAYTGLQIKPLITFIEGEPISESDYTLTYASNIDGTGIVYVYVTDGNYKLEGGSYIELTFVISKDFSLFNLIINDVEYNGKAQTPDIYLSGVVQDFSNFADFEWSNNINAGQASVTITAKKNSTYTGSTTVYFNILPKTISVVWGNVSFTYNGKAQAPTATATGVYGEEISVIVSGGKTNAGTYTATATIENGNYKLSNDKTDFTIAKLKVEVVWGEAEFTYNGKEQAPTATATGANGEQIVLVVSGTQTEAGEYTATATTENGNYELINATKEFSIVDLQVTAITVKEGLTLGGSFAGGVVGIVAVYGAGVGVGKLVVLFMKKKWL